MSSVLNKLLWSLDHRGLAGTMRAVTQSLGRKFQTGTAEQVHPFDREHGTDTGGLISGADLASGYSSDRFIEGYAAVPPSRFQNILARWQASDLPHSLTDYTFLDIGCGKGRAALLASEYDFREVIGVELNPVLAGIARANADLWVAAGKARCPIRVEQGDALDLSFQSGPTLVFLFNPFGKELMDQLVERMQAAFTSRPADLEVVYYKPEHSATFADHFQMLWCETIEISPEDLAVDPVADPRDETRAFRLSRRST